MQEQTSGGIFTKAETAERLRISISTLEREMARRAITFKRASERRVLFTEHDIVQYLARREDQSA